MYRTPEGSLDPLDEAWNRIDRDWDDEKAHDSYLALADALGSLGVAGRRYGEVREAGGSRAEFAERQIERIQGRALAQLHSTRTESDAVQRVRRWSTWVGLVIAVGLIAVALNLMLRSL